MSGHSHWAGIKHRKGINDAKRAKIFTKLCNLVTIAAREGGGNPEFNFKLKLAIDQAKYANVPKDKIERAIKRGTGELKGEAEIEEVVYEGYGPGNVAMLIKCATDKKTRTVGEIKTTLMKNGGKMVPAGSVAFMFKQMGAIEINVPEGADISELEMKAIDAGAEDTSFTDSTLTIHTLTEGLQKTKELLEKNNLAIENAGLIYVPAQKTKLNEESRHAYEKLLEVLDDLEDVQEIYDNL